MQKPDELRELAAYHREAAKTANEEGRAWRVSLAEFLETLAGDIERESNADHSRPS